LWNKQTTSAAAQVSPPERGIIPCYLAEIHLNAEIFPPFGGKKGGSKFNNNYYI